MEDCPRRVLNNWDAYWQIEPWGSERELLAKCVATLKRLLATKYNEDVIERVLDAVDKAAAYYMPWDWIDQPKREQVSEEEYWANVEKVLSSHGNNH